MGKDDGSCASFAIGETQVISQQITSIIWSIRITNAGPPTACICLEGHGYSDLVISGPPYHD